MVHKEWPTTMKKGRRRGNFDIVVLAPNFASGEPDLEYHFLEGHFVPAIVIELGLDYPHDHLRKDLEKLKNNAVPAGYIIHFVRGRGPDEEERSLLKRDPNATVQTAAVFTKRTRRWVKHLEDSELNEQIPNV